MHMTPIAFENFRFKSKAPIIGAFAILLVGCTTSDSASKNESSEPANDPLQILDNAIVEQPNDPSVYHDRAVWKLAQSDPQGAFDDWDLALRADSGFALAWEEQADMLFQMQKFEDCLSKLDGCLQHAPESTPCMLKRAEFSIHLQQFEQAFQYLNDALRLNDQLHDAYWMKGKIYALTGADDKALSSYQTAIEVNPEFYEGFITLGIFLAERSNAMAEEYYRSAMELRPSAVEPVYNLAMFYQNAGRLAESLDLYRDILLLDPENATASFNQGYIHLEYLAEYDSAVHWFSEAIQRLPYYHQAFFNRGLAFESLGMSSAAIEDYTQALKIKPDYTSAALAKERAMKGQ
jgi:tetratricopeptide (TPR) repeat protein